MEIEHSSLLREITSIISSGAKPVHNTWSSRIYVNNGDLIIPFKLVSIDRLNDYMLNYTEYLLVEVAIPRGTFAKRVYPYLNNLEMELICQPIGEDNDSADVTLQNQVERYNANMIDIGNPIFEQATRNTATEEEMNLAGFVNVQFMLMNKAVQLIRMVSIGGNYTEHTGEEVIKALLTKYSQSVKVDDARKIKGVDMVKASNQEKRGSIMIPHGTPLVELPHHIHYKCGGLYSSGLGYYLDSDYWYLFPAYDTTRFNDAKDTLTIINLPPNRFPQIERTYRKDGGNLVILATGDTKFEDLSNRAQLNAGSGARFAIADKMMDGFVVTKGNKAVASRAKNNTEVITSKRPDGNNLVTLGNQAINSNPFVEYSALAARQGSGATFTWQNGNPSLLRPGMPVKVQYLDGDTIKTMMGVLLKNHGFIAMKESGLTSTRYMSNIMLGVFLKPLTEDYVEPDPLT